MIDRRILTCYNCGAWDDEREGCTMPAPDRQYACPLSDAERHEHEFEFMILRARQKKAEREG